MKINGVVMRQGYLFSHSKRAKGLVLNGIKAYLGLLGRCRIRLAPL